MTRTSYLLYKSLRYVISFFVITTITFLIPRLMPGDPFISILGKEVYFHSPDVVRELKSTYGLDRPLPDQYFAFIFNLFHGNLGYSFHYSVPVADILLYKLMWTLVLLLPSVILGAVFGIILGGICGWKSGSKTDKCLTSGTLFIYSMPHYWLAMLMVIIFGYYLNLFPLGGITEGGYSGVEKIVDVLWHMCLPVGILTLFSTTFNFLIIRNSVIQFSHEDFVLCARAFGLSEWQILWRHVMRNAILPLITVIALDFGFMVSGALLVEIIFSWGGMGTLMYDAILVRDYPLLYGIFLLIGLCVIFANFIADILYMVLDPRIKPYSYNE